MKLKISAPLLNDGETELTVFLSELFALYRSLAIKLISKNFSECIEFLTHAASQECLQGSVGILQYSGCGLNSRITLEPFYAH